MGTNPYKAVVVGDGACGKTWLIAASQNQTPDSDAPARYHKCSIDVTVQGQRVQLDLYDTAGQDDYDSLCPAIYKDADVFLMCFSIDWPDSLTNVFERWQPKVKSLCPDAPIILVATKKDLRHDARTINELAAIRERPLSIEDGCEAAALNALGYVECSARTGEGVECVFKVGAMAAVERRRQRNIDSRYESVV